MINTEVSTSLLKVPIVGGKILTLDLKEVRELEARKIEIGGVNKLKAPELMQAMERGYSLVAQTMLPAVAYQLAKAEEAADERKAVVMLDIVPELLAKKGLTTARNPSGSADQRENVLALDIEYKDLKNTVDMLQAVKELLKGKMKGFEMAYGAVKKVYDSLSTYGVLGNSSPADLSSGISDDLESGDTDEMIGTPRYLYGK